MTRLAGTVAAIVYAASLMGALVAQRPGGAAPVETAERDDGRRAVVGFAINLHHTNHLPKYHQSIDELADMGVTGFELLTPAFQHDGVAEAITIETGPGRGPEREQILALLAHAKRRGLTTALMPTVLFTDPRGNEWRGKISPENWDRWWQSYGAMFDHFLDIAVEADVDILSIGSELLTTEKQTDRWRALIRHARGRFNGRLIYSTNWDHFHVPMFWQEIDLIGVSGYWNMTKDVKDGKATDDDLALRWQSIQESIFAYAEAQGTRVLITEVGYPTLPWALKDPWNYVHSGKHGADPQTQARGYRAMLKAWENPIRQSRHMAGMFFYAWDPYHAGGAGDTGYGVRGKPAEGLVREWLKRVMN